MAAVVDAVPVELATMQDELKVPAASRISSMPVAQPTDPVVDGKPRLQATAGAGAAGLLAVLVLTAFLDGLLLRRSSRRSVRTEGSPRRTRRAMIGTTGSDEVSRAAEESDRVLVPVAAADPARRQKHQV